MSHITIIFTGKKKKTHKKKVNIFQEIVTLILGMPEIFPGFSFQTPNYIIGLIIKLNDVVLGLMNASGHVLGLLKFIIQSLRIKAQALFKGSN